MIQRRGPAGNQACRQQDFQVVERLSQWKATSREGAHAQGQMYLGRHYYKLGMSDGSIWTVYFIRQAPKSGSRKQRWFLYSID